MDVCEMRDCHNQVLWLHTIRIFDLYEQIKPHSRLMSEVTAE